MYDEDTKNIIVKVMKVIKKLKLYENDDAITC